MIFQLSYKSESRYDLFPQDLDDILITAMERNYKENITGCLVYFESKFYQLLEGNKEAVLSVYESIKKDLRHKNVTLLNQEKVSERIFSDWSMSYYYLDKERNSEVILSEFKEKTMVFETNDYSLDIETDFWKDIRSKIDGSQILQP